MNNLEELKKLIEKYKDDEKLTSLLIYLHNYYKQLNTRYNYYIENDLIVPDYLYEQIRTLKKVIDTLREDD